MTNTRFSRRLLLALGAVALAFACSTLAATWRSSELESHADAVALNALPSVARLTAACDALRNLEAAADDFAELPAERQRAQRATIDREWRAVDAEMTAYLGLPAFPGEREMYESGVPAALRDVDMALARLFSRVEGRETAEARAAGERDVGAATNRAAELLRGLIRLNAEHADSEVRTVVTQHRSASRDALLLDGLAAVFGIVVGLWALRQFRKYDRLLQTHAAMVERRADELELFGKRVAHDLLSPLSALTYCLGAFKRPSEGDPKLQDALARARACVLRAQKMTDGIFEFARAGGKPEPDARCDVREVLDQVSDELQTAETDERPEVTVEPFEASVVACPPGVVGSIMTNLMRNAAKYMSDSALKRITVRVAGQGPMVRVEVEDTGPGVPQGMEALIFEPYVRAVGVTQAGLGLGLATVKRLCTAYGGDVGVRSTPGKGSAFWFTLPKASTIAAPEPRANSSLVRRIS